MNPYPPFQFKQGGGFDGGPMMFHGHDGGPHGLAVATFFLVLLIALTLFALIVARAASRGGHHRKWHHRMAFVGPGGRPDPLELLRMRYARGEIDRDTFLQGVSDLTPEKPSD
ncbi:MAG TPA: hypothetical protein VLE97_00460 [Gaiellaceae bacterium]|nr:hypothetical protein [Gaiellaceae bacterium]